MPYVCESVHNPSDYNETTLDVSRIGRELDVYHCGIRNCWTYESTAERSNTAQGLG